MLNNKGMKLKNPGSYQNTVNLNTETKTSAKNKGKWEERVIEVLSNYPDGIESSQLRKEAGLNMIIFWVVIESLLSRDIIIRKDIQDKQYYYLKAL